jgi:hypothetical protein
MIVRQSNELSFLAKEAGKTEKEISKTIVSELVKNEMVYDEPESWGCNVFDCIDKDILVSDVVNIIRKTGIKVVKSKHLDAFLALVFMGCGDCPECGGEMEVVDGEYRCCGGDGYLTPYEYEPIWEEKQCNNCGYKD